VRAWDGNRPRYGLYSEGHQFPPISVCRGDESLHIISTVDSRLLCFMDVLMACSWLWHTASSFRTLNGRFSRLFIVSICFRVPWVSHLPSILFVPQMTALPSRWLHAESQRSARHRRCRWGHNCVLSATVRRWPSFREGTYHGCVVSVEVLATGMVNRGVQFEKHVQRLVSFSWSIYIYMSCRRKFERVCWTHYFTAAAAGTSVFNFDAASVFSPEYKYISTSHAFLPYSSHPHREYLLGGESWGRPFPCPWALSSTGSVMQHAHRLCLLDQRLHYQHRLRSFFPVTGVTQVVSSRPSPAANIWALPLAVPN
jgi:hypothetical protein